MNNFINQTTILILQSEQLGYDLDPSDDSADEDDDDNLEDNDMSSDNETSNNNASLPPKPLVNVTPDSTTLEIAGVKSFHTQPADTDMKPQQAFQQDNKTGMIQRHKRNTSY